MEEPVNHPQHYQGEGGLEVIVAMLGIFGTVAVYWFCILNAFKYICRAGKKGKQVEDLQKAVWYLQEAIKHVNG